MRGSARPCWYSRAPIRRADVLEAHLGQAPADLEVGVHALLGPAEDLHHDLVGRTRPRCCSARPTGGPRAGRSDSVSRRRSSGEVVVRSSAPASESKLRLRPNARSAASMKASSAVASNSSARSSQAAHVDPGHGRVGVVGQHPVGVGPGGGGDGHHVGLGLAVGVLDLDEGDEGGRLAPTHGHRHGVEDLGGADRLGPPGVPAVAGEERAARPGPGRCGPDPGPGTAGASRRRR